MNIGKVTPRTEIIIDDENENSDQMITQQSFNRNSKNNASQKIAETSASTSFRVPKGAQEIYDIYNRKLMIKEYRTPLPKRMPKYKKIKLNEGNDRISTPIDTIMHVQSECLLFEIPTRNKPITMIEAILYLAKKKIFLEIIENNPMHKIMIFRYYDIEKIENVLNHLKVNSTVNVKQLLNITLNIWFENIHVKGVKVNLLLLKDIKYNLALLMLK